MNNTFDEIDTKMKIYNINWKNCSAFSSDNALVMLSKSNSVF